MRLLKHKSKFTYQDGAILSSKGFTVTGETIDEEFVAFTKVVGGQTVPRSETITVEDTITEGLNMDAINAEGPDGVALDGMSLEAIDGELAPKYLTNKSK